MSTTPLSKALLTPIMMLAVVSIGACGGSNDTATLGSDLSSVLDNTTAPSSDPMTDSTPVTVDEDQNLRNLNINFSVPERLQLIGTALQATVTAGGAERTMLPVGSGFEATLQLPQQQLVVYVGVRRAEDGLLLAAADTTARLGDDDATIHLPEQLFGYEFDQDGDGVNNLVEIERGTSPASASLDFDADGVLDDSDLDDDNDGIADTADAFPFNGQEFEDTDGDGIGNNSDEDDDNDGFLDENDAFPSDPDEASDSDGDGIGDNQDTDADGNGVDDTQEDSDGDGVPDQIDLYPNDYYESADTDGDGIGDNQDSDDNNNGIIDYREGAQLIIPYVDDADIVLDGYWDVGYLNDEYYEEWAKATETDSIGNSLYLDNLQIDNTGRHNGAQYNPAYSIFKMLHDGEYLYAFISIGSEPLENWFNDSPEAWRDDSVELYFDIGYDQADTYGDDDYQRIFRFRDSATDPILDGPNSASGLQTEYATSYRHENDAVSVYRHLYEIRVKLSSIGLQPGDTFGLEVAANDDDDGGYRDTKWGWWAPIGVDEAWYRPSSFGKAKLQPAD